MKGSAMERRLQPALRIVGFSLLLLFYCSYLLADSTVSISILSILKPTQVNLTLLSPDRASVQFADSQTILAAKKKLQIEIHGGLLTFSGRKGLEAQIRAERPCTFEIEVPGQIKRAYHGDLYLYAIDSAISIVLHLSQSELLSSITASEMGEIRNPEALKAFAVVARSFLAAGPRHPSLHADLCDTTHCQVFQGFPPTQEARKAVQQTEGLILTYRQIPFRPYYFRSCGGKTATYFEIWGKESPDYPFASVSCPCKNIWSARIPFGQLHSAIGFPIVQIQQRGTQIQFNGVNQQNSYSLEEFRTLIGRTSGWNQVKSNWFAATQEGNELILSGKGIGHRVGFCQNGASILGLQGKSFLEILQFYFPNTEVRSRL
jgi:SpoIID/LytB domain protein